MMSSSSPIDLSLCYWNANGLLRRNVELRIFIEKHSPDIFLIKETHLRPSPTFNIANSPAIEMIESPADRRWNSDFSKKFSQALLSPHTLHD
ncbi:hypothetical protein TNCV_2527441 [Trichonephila clavipes]|nr:hypothetical protein TNCV_2527441 [Trichonephila clavipes]